MRDAAARAPGTRLRLLLLPLLGALYAVFIAAAAFRPALFAQPLFAGGTVTVWFAYALGLIWASVLTTGLYVWRVNAMEGRPRGDGAREGRP